MANYHVKRCDKKGILTKGKTVYELSKVCECGFCRFRVNKLKERRNSLTVYTDYLNKVPEVMKFLDEWNCNSDKALPVTVLNFDEMNHTAQAGPLRIRSGRITALCYMEIFAMCVREKRN